MSNTNNRRLYLRILKHAYEKDGLIEYIKNQEAHHKIETYEDEYQRLLKEHDIDFNEKYLFDE